MLRILYIIFGLIVLIAVRYGEENLFYDPLIAFYTSDYSELPLPQMDLWKLIGAVCIRFLINTGASLLIIWAIFKELDFIKVSLWIYGLFFTVVLIVFAILLNDFGPKGHLALFYTRRFLIQPILLLILIPALYMYQKNSTKN